MSNAEVIRKNIKTLMSNGEVWEKAVLEKSLKDINSTWTQGMISGAIQQLIDREPNKFKRISYGNYQYIVEEESSIIEKAVNIINNAREEILSIGKSINPITASESDMEISLELKKVLQKLNECKEILGNIH